MNKIIKVSRLILLFILLLFSSIFAATTETLTITTYYPAPYGSYLKVTSDTMAIGEGYRGSAIPANGLIVEGQVGIGTSTVGIYGAKQAELDVSGEIAANDIYVKDKGQWLSSMKWCTQVNYVLKYDPDTSPTPCPSGTYTWFQAVSGAGPFDLPTSGSFLCCSS